MSPRNSLLLGTSSNATCTDGVLCTVSPSAWWIRKSAGPGTVMRPSKLLEYALEAGFADVEILPVENDFWRFYRLA